MNSRNLRRFCALTALFLAWLGSGGTSGRAHAETVVYQQHLDPYPVHIVVPVNFGGETANFILDTAFDLCSCDPALQKRLGPKEKPELMIGAAKSTTMETYECPALSIGGHQAGKQRVVMMDMAPFRAASGVDLRGVLGTPGFRDLAICLDFDHESLKLIKHFDSPPPDMQVQDLEFEPGSHVPVVNVFFMSRGVKFDLDLGNTAAFLLNEEAFKKFVTTGALNLDTASHHADLSITGEEHHQRTGTWESWLLWGQDVRYSSATEGQVNAIGLQFLVNFNLVIDLEHAKLYYQKRKAPPPIEPYIMLGGLIFMDDGCGVVREMREDVNPLWNAGLRKGDKILRLGPLRKGDFTDKSLYELALNHAGKTVDVEYLHQGETKSMTGHLTIGPLKFAFADPGKR